MCKNGANLAFHACLQQNGVTALTPENAERKLTKKNAPSDCINCCTRKFGMNSINHHFSFRDSSWLLVINWFVIQSMYNLQTQIVVYDRNHYFGLGLKPKPKLGDTFGGYRNRYQKQHLKRENLVTDSMRYFFLHKRAPKTKFSSKH